LFAPKPLVRVFCEVVDGCVSSLSGTLSNDGLNIHRRIAEKIINEI